MSAYHKSFDDEFPEGLALAMERGEPWEDVPYVAFMLKTRAPTHEDMAWAMEVIERDKRIRRM